MALFPPLIAGLMRLLNMSCRVVYIEGEQLDREEVAKHGGRAVYCTWHQRMFYHFHYFGRLHVTMMISQSKDGEWARRTAHKLGFKSVRGSTKRKGRDKGGKNAMLALIEKVKQGESAGMLVDGPVGPAREVKMGALIIAKETGAPLICEMWGCDRAWVINSWDKYIIPKPFSRVCIVHGKPRYIPQGATPEELEEIRLNFQQEMNDAAKWCDDYFGVTRPLMRENTTTENQ